MYIYFPTTPDINGTLIKTWDTVPFEVLGGGAVGRKDLFGQKKIVVRNMIQASLKAMTKCKW